MFHLNLLFYMLNFYQSSNTVTCQCGGSNFFLSLLFCSWLLHHFLYLLFPLACFTVVFEGKIKSAWVTVRVVFGVAVFWELSIGKVVVIGSTIALFFVTVTIVIFTSFRCFGLCLYERLEYCCYLDHVIWFNWWLGEWWHLGAIGLACWGF